jgi:glycerol-3-phosphate O-acyltransferase
MPSQAPSPQSVSSAPRRSLWQSVQLRWRLLLRWILHIWVRARVLPDPFSDSRIEPGKPTCFVLDTYDLSSVLILDRCCEQLGLQRPLHAIPGNRVTEPRSYAALRRLSGLLVRRPTARRSSDMLKKLVEDSCDDPAIDIQFVPVTILVGRTPDKETGLAKILFSENWEVAGRLRRLASTLINGRSTFVHFSRPISSAELALEGLGAGRSLRKLSRILRIHFRRERAAAIGPDLSHRRTVVDSILKSPAVLKAVEDKARREKIPKLKAQKAAQGYAREIAANYSYSVVRIAAMFLSWFWHRIYDGVDVHNFMEFKEQSIDHEIIYVPCHRSHIDYLLASYLLYNNGMVPPHVAAGVNLNLPLVGRLLRRGGAFFLRRSFHTHKLYSAVFNEYLSSIQAQGTSIEYFIEGTRSRTGRLLPPKAGMISMTVRGYLRNPVKPIMFQPIYIGYERLVEGDSYTRELYGRKKKSETLAGFFKSWKIIREKYGKVHFSFGKPIFLDQMLDSHAPEWKENSESIEQKPAWFSALVDELGLGIMTGINSAANVNSVNLISSILLSTVKQSLGERELLAQIALCRRLIANSGYSDRISITGRSEADVIEYCLELGIIERRSHALGDILRMRPDDAIALTYFRNNISHLMAMPSLVACCFINHRECSRQQLERITLDVQSFLTSELFLPWDRDEYLQQVNRTIVLLTEEGLLQSDENSGVISRAEGGTDPAEQLRLLASGLLQTLERYFITVTVLAKNGSGTLSRQKLERLCFMTAQRISMLHEFDAPEFSDRSLFRQFIAQLRKTDVLRTNEAGNLEYNDALGRLSDDARYILSKEIRHSIIQMAPQMLEQVGDED